MSSHARIKAVTASLALSLVSGVAAQVPAAQAKTTPVCPRSSSGAQLPVVSVGGGRSPRVNGSALIRTSNGESVVKTFGHAPHAAGNMLTAASKVSLEFCLRAPQTGRQVTLVRVTPGDVSLTVAKNRRLTLAADGATGRATIVGHAPLKAGNDVVRITLDSTAQQATLSVNGGHSVTGTTRLAHAMSIFVGADSAPTTIAAPTAALSATAGTSVLSRAITSNASTSAAPVAATATKPTSTTTAAATPTTTASPAATPADTTPVSWPGNPFSPTSFFNQPLTNGAALSPSQTYATNLQQQATSFGTYMNTTSYAVPVDLVPADQPLQHVTLDTNSIGLQTAFNAVPLPTNAVASVGTDGDETVWQPSTDTLWEFYRFKLEADGYHAAWGGEMNNVSSNPGYFTPGYWGTSASGMPLLGGLVTFADLQRGSINHALAISIPQATQGVFSYPAQRTDGSGNSTLPTSVPEGTRFRLNPSINIAALKLPPFDYMLAKAAQTYGIVVRDRGGCVSFVGQDPTGGTANPWPAAIGGSTSSVLNKFPWQYLQVLQPTAE